MWTPMERQAVEASFAGVPGGNVDDHLATIPACAALGIRLAPESGRTLALFLDTELKAVRARDGTVDPGAALVLADQATANGIFAILPAPVPMMTLGLQVDWVARPGAGKLICAIDDVIREGELALVRGVLSMDEVIIGAATARYLLGAMPGGHRDHNDVGEVGARSEATSFDAYLDAQTTTDRLSVSSRWEHVGARQLPAFHGGVIAALIERTARSAAGPDFRLLDMEVRFLAPGRADRPLHASAQPRRIGRRAATIDVTAYQDDPAKPVAIGRMMAVSDGYEQATAYRLP